MEPQLKPIPIDNSRASWSPSEGFGRVQMPGVASGDQSKVLRNTYWLLALSMLPTIAGALFGMSLDLAAFYKASPIAAPLLTLAAMFGMLFVVQALRNSSWGVLAIFGFTFVSGMMLAPTLQYAAHLRNGGQLVALAGGMTAAVFFVMATIATVTKRDFSFMGKFLFIGLVLLIIASIANLFFQVPAVAASVSAIAVLIFSGFLLYDVSSIVRGGQNNYIMATLSLFLDILNIFMSLLNLLMMFAGQRD